MRKLVTIIALFAFALTGCSSDDSGNSNEETDNGGEVVKRATYGSFTVNTAVNNKDVTYKYWNYYPISRIEQSLGKTYLIMSDIIVYESKEEKDAITKERIAKYGELRGGRLTVSISKPEEGVFTITRGFSYYPKEIANIKNRLATIEVTLGIENEEGRKDGKNDAKYVYVDDGYYVDALEVTKDKNGIFHYTLKKPIPLVFKEGTHGYGNTNAPKQITVTIDDGYSIIPSIQ